MSKYRTYENGVVVYKDIPPIKGNTKAQSDKNLLVRRDDLRQCCGCLYGQHQIYMEFHCVKQVIATEYDDTCVYWEKKRNA